MLDAEIEAHHKADHLYCSALQTFADALPALGIVAAVTSSLREVAIKPGLLVLGEVGLGGEVRAVSQAELRIREAAKMGFKRCLLPERNLAKVDPIDGIELVGITEVGEALNVVFA